MSHYALVVTGENAEEQIQPFSAHTDYNPHAEWDWYVIGGRWKGFFKAKDGASGQLGEPSVFEKVSGNISKPKNRFDVIRIKDVDFEGERQKHADRAKEDYENVMSIIGDLPKNLPFDHFRSKYGKDIDKAKEMYWKQSRCRAWIKAEGSNKPLGIRFYSKPDDYLISKKEYIENGKMNGHVPFAILHDMQWISNGDMGWWGIQLNKKMEDVDWRKKVNQFYDYILREDPDTLLTCFDCHI